MKGKEKIAVFMSNLPKEGFFIISIYLLCLKFISYFFLLCHCHEYVLVFFLSEYFSQIFLSLSLKAGSPKAEWTQPKSISKESAL